ncbi:MULTISPECIES: hypothetical protein [Campylobacter]|uniref:hypothetical protein n=1 Tax=Campylobacter TaxID=194 RepID=UPI0015D8A3DD|nr:MULTISPECIES: hypothetical protein [unclassified Campylobacter]MCR8679244.1 hypothetical protein [Campylobacter sp. RM19072]MCR8697157.1 hypothetical protein [Campylobacter sp. RM19073]
MSLIQKLIKHKIAKSKDKQKLIDEMITTLGTRANEELKEALEEIYMAVMSNYDSPELKSIIKDRLENLDIHIKDINYEDLYRSFLEGVGGRSDLRFDSVDARAIKVMRENFYWIKGEFNAKVSDELKDITQEIFEGKIPRVKAGEIMREKFKGVLSVNTSYFEGVSDHIISQMQNISRVNEASKNGVEYYKVVARIDSRTSQCCRSMNGRIVPASHIEAQSRNIQNAKSIDEKKAAATWRNGAFYGKILPKNFGLPPYHFRCRTEVVPVWIDEEVIDGVVMKNTSPLSKDEVVKHIDKTGVERVLSKDNYFGSGNHSMPLHKKAHKRDIVRALNSIERVAVNNKNPNRLNAMSQNGYFLVFDGVELVTIYKPTNSLEKYFKKNSVLTQGEIIKSSIFARWFK